MKRLFLIIFCFLASISAAAYTDTERAGDPSFLSAFDKTLTRLIGAVHSKPFRFVYMNQSLEHMGRSAIAYKQGNLVLAYRLVEQSRRHYASNEFSFLMRGMIRLEMRQREEGLNDLITFYKMSQRAGEFELSFLNPSDYLQLKTGTRRLLLSEGVKPEALEPSKGFWARIVKLLNGYEPLDQWKNYTLVVLLLAFSVAVIAKIGGSDFNLFPLNCLSGLIIGLAINYLLLIFFPPGTSVQALQILFGLLLLIFLISHFSRVMNYLKIRYGILPDGYSRCPHCRYPILKVDLECSHCRRRIPE